LSLEPDRRFLLFLLLTEPRANWPHSSSRSGIGLETSLLFATEGASLILADINVEAAERTSQLISNKFNGEIKAIAVRCDVSKEDQIEAIVKRAVDEFGRLDIMVRGIALELFDLVLIVSWGITEPSMTHSSTTQESCTQQMTMPSSLKNESGILRRTSTLKEYGTVASTPSSLCVR
jgi:hypothetical protein